MESREQRSKIHSHYHPGLRMVLGRIAKSTPIIYKPFTTKKHGAQATESKGEREQSKSISFDSFVDRGYKTLNDLRTVMRATSIAIYHICHHLSSRFYSRNLDTTFKKQYRYLNAPHELL